MAFQKRNSSVPPNVIKLTLDYATLDRLKAVAASRKVDTYRCAYELLQERLSMRSRLPAPLRQ